MVSIIKRILKKLFPVYALQYKAYKKLVKNTDSYLYTTGWMQSLKERRSVDRNGSPIPWMNFPVIRLLDEKLKGDMNLFEYGSGYSTFFYADRVKNVITVEYDKDWYEFIRSGLPENVELIYQEKDIDGDYCRVINTTDKKFDVIIIDGRDRVNCLKQGIQSLTPGGVILLDDSERDRYQEGIKYAKECGFRTLNIEGLKATESDIERTTIFYRDGNCFEI